MANPKQPDRWESLTLAVAMAAGAVLFLFDKLGSLMQNGTFSLHLNSTPILLAVVAVVLVLADQRATDADAKRDKRGRYE